MQGHTIQECRIHNNQKVRVEDTEIFVEENVAQQQPRMHQQFQKGKDKILSSGKIVGDPRVWKVVGRKANKQVAENSTQITNRFAVLTDDPHDEENQESTIPHVDTIDQQNPAVTGSNADSSEKVERVHGKDHEGTSVECQGISHSGENLSIATPSVNLHCPTSDTIKENMNEEEMLTEGEDSDVAGKENLNSCLSQTIVEVPRVVQLDDSQLIQMESPNKVLHNIISHNIEIENIGNNESEGTQIAKGLMEDDSTEELWDVQLEADLSPRLLKSARKGKKQGDGDKNMPIRVQHKRVKTAHNKQ
ncbi:hypothetical protein KY290_033077 [Solanum tuberosum]|uniref:Uncharacterized protein n=1 Tax=Solanum tuberosum TaxID=4113 RepID=A0ABQ7TZ87_SOLTU|nr:hypothetical protein KY285_032327 [Solanum tuberosum]KAH0740034.1 hypothetical protein KY290_033077 [Solanum tuberosum]